MQLKPLRGTRRTGLSVSLNETQALEAAKVWTTHSFLGETDIYMVGIKCILENPDDYKKKE